MSEPPLKKRGGKPFLKKKKKKSRFDVSLKL